MSNATITGLSRCSSHNSSRVLYFFQKCCLCVLGHEDSLSCLLPPSFSKGPSLFDFHLASLLPLPYSFICSARAINSNRCLQPLCRSLGKRLAYQRKPTVVSTCPPQYDPHATSVARSLARSGSGEASERASDLVFLMGTPTYRCENKFHQYVSTDHSYFGSEIKKLSFSANLLSFHDFSLLFQQYQVLIPENMMPKSLNC